MRRPVEEVEQDVLKYITIHMQDRAGLAPTLNEIGEGVGIAPATAQRYVRMLVKQGLVVRTQHGLFARNINLPEAVWLPTPASLSALSDVLPAPAPVAVTQSAWVTFLASLGAWLGTILY